MKRRTVLEAAAALAAIPAAPAIAGSEGTLQVLQAVMAEDPYGDPDTGVFITISGPGDGGADSQLRVKPVAGGYEVVKTDGWNSLKYGFNGYHQFAVGDVVTEAQLVEVARKYIEGLKGGTP